MPFKQQFTKKNKGLLVRAPAKINLTLLVAGKRPDGFHNLETIMTKINWYDEILIQHSSKKGIDLICKGPHWAPQGRENLIYKACELILKTAKLSANIKITLTKNIPAGTGLGSASSDAAATIIGLNKFLNLNINTKKLNQVAAQIGSDVAFFLGGPLSLCTGKGEKIRKIDKIFNFSTILMLPNVSVPTAKVYKNHQPNIPLYQKLKREIDCHIQKNRIDLAAKMCANMLQISCFGLYDELAELKNECESLLSRPVCLSGSGSTLFCIFSKKEKKEVLYWKHKLKKEIGCKIVIVSNNGW